MGRTVIAARDIVVTRGVEAASPQQVPDDYLNRLVKYIPPDVIATYSAISGILGSDSKMIVAQWVLFAIFIVLMWPYLSKVAKVTKWQQILISIGAFIAWFLAFPGDPLNNGTITWWHTQYGSAILLLFVFVAPLFTAEN